MQGQGNKPDRISPGISSFAWSPDNSKCAVCPQGREILIFKTFGKPNISDWQLEAVLKEVSVFRMFGFKDIQLHVSDSLFPDNLALQCYQLIPLAPKNKCVALMLG